MPYINGRYYYNFMTMLGMFKRAVKMDIDKSDFSYLIDKLKIRGSRETIGDSQRGVYRTFCSSADYFDALLRDKNFIERARQEIREMETRRINSIGASIVKPKFKFDAEIAPTDDKDSDKSKTVKDVDDSDEIEDENMEKVSDKLLKDDGVYYY